jgi:hypothetical protein
MSLRAWARERSLGILFVSLFLATWVAQLVVQWFDFRSEQEAHGESASFWSSAYWLDFWQATFENWQSEFLQISAFIIATAYLVYRGSAESGDADERIEAKLDALLNERGIEPSRIESRLPDEKRRRPEDVP